MGRWLKYLATWSNKNFKNVSIFSNDVLFFVFVWTHFFQMTSIKSHQIGFGYCFIDNYQLNFSF